MEVGETTNEKNWKAYENCCIELDAIKRKLDNGDLPEGKRERLLFRQKDLRERIIPKFSSRIHGYTSSARLLRDDF